MIIGKGLNISSRGLRLFSSLGEAFNERVSKLPHKNAIKALHSGDNYCYAELDKHSAALASGLIELGLKSGDKVATWLGNDVENAVTQVAAAKGGFLLAVIDPDMKDSRSLGLALKDSQASVLIYNPDHGRNNSAISEAIPELSDSSPGYLKASSFPSLKYVVATGRDMAEGSLNINETLVYGPEPHPLESIKLNDKTPYLSTYSASNGGKSDGKTLSQGDVLNNAKNLGAKLNLNADDRVLSTYKHSSEFGVTANFAIFLKNSNVVVPSSKFDKDSTIKALSNQEPNVLVSDKDSVAILRSSVTALPKTIRVGAVSGAKENLVGVDLLAA